MTFHALKEPITMVSRSRPGSSPPRMRLPPSTARRTLCGSSRVLTALDAEMRSKTENDDDSIEILGPFPGVSKTEGSISRARVAAKPLHPYFANGSGPDSGPAGSRNKTIPILHRTAATAADSTTTAKADKPPKPTSSNLKVDASIFPAYSYKDYLPKATTVYTQHEQEANDLVDMLRGPLGFDMEWRVIFRRGVGERKTALVQLSDERMILLIQISSMTKFPQKVKEVIESPGIIKLGANIYNDGAKLFRDFGIRAQNLVELGALAKHVDPSFAAVHSRAIVSLASVVAHYARKSLKKGTERTGNWEAKLEQNMIDYAANDAHCAVVVYKNIMVIAREHGINLSPAAYTSSVTGFPKAAAAPMGDTMTASSSINATNITEQLTSSSTTISSSGFPVAVLTERAPSERSRPQHLRAYQMWHYHCKPLQTICAELTSREAPLKESTVISYVINALQNDRQLPFDMKRLKELVQVEASSWRRHRVWIAGAEAEGRGA